jgi:hypothetical protein
VRVLLVSCFSLLALALSGCGRPFDVKTAPGFVELEDQPASWSYRSISSEGVVVAVRVLDDQAGDLAFWTRATSLQMTQIRGYTLTETRDATSRDGTKGSELVFRHDTEDRSYVYRIRLFVTQRRLFVVEVGGDQAQMERHTPSVDWMVASMKVRCDGPLTPVLASRTCNRW